MPSIQPKKKFLLRILMALIIISLGLIWLFRTQGSAAQKVFSVLPKFSITCLLLVIFLDALQIFLMAVRFWLLYPKGHRTKLRLVFTAMSIGQTMNAFLPARAGDFYKVATLVPKPSKPDFGILALTGILTSDKLVDTLAFLILIFGLGSYKTVETPFNINVIQDWKYLVALILILLACWHFFLKNRFTKLTLWIRDFVQGLKSLLSPSQLVLALGTAVLVWLCEAAALQQLAAYQDTPLSISQTFFVLTMLNIAIAVPLSVANIGPFEASIAFALTKLGMPIESALAVATVHHGLQVSAYAICGALGWLIRKFSLLQIK